MVRYRLPLYHRSHDHLAFPPPNVSESGICSVATLRSQGQQRPIISKMRWGDDCATGLYIYRLCEMKLPRGSKVVPFLGLTFSLLRDSNIQPKKELLWSLWVGSASPVCLRLSSSRVSTWQSCWLCSELLCWSFFSARPHNKTKRSFSWNYKGLSWCLPITRRV